MDLSATPLVELRARFVSLGDQLSAIANERAALLAEIEIRERRAAATLRLSLLDQQAKDSLKEML